MDNMQLKHRLKVFSQIVAETACTHKIHENIDLEEAMYFVLEHLRELRSQSRTLYIVGNGGSAAIASHALVDFVNVAKINAQVLHESSLITCISNDYGYENAYSRVLSAHMKPEDMVIAISSSGKSLNIYN